MNKWKLLSTGGMVVGMIANLVSAYSNDKIKNDRIDEQIDNCVKVYLDNYNRSGMNDQKH